jgi:hypothetical protein
MHYRPRANVACWLADGNIILSSRTVPRRRNTQNSLYNIRIAGIKVLRSPTWKRAEIEATIRIIIKLPPLKLSYKRKLYFIYLFIIIIYSSIIIVQMKTVLRNSPRRYLIKRDTYIEGTHGCETSSIAHTTSIDRIPAHCDPS